MTPLPSRQNRGFTLIELLVVISIIGLLSSVILAALAGARQKGQATAITSELIQFRNLYELSYSSKGDYSLLQPIHAAGGFASNNSPVECAKYLGIGNGSYQCTTNDPTGNGCIDIFGPGGEIPDTTAVNLCKQIVKNSGSFAVGLAKNSNVAQQYSFWTQHSSQNTYICYGSSKQTSSISTQADILNVNGNSNPGCSANP